MTVKLGVRALNRSLLARQWLLERVDRPVEDALVHLVGLQAQTPQSPYVSLWSRLAPFDPEDVSRLLDRRKAVRMAVQRGTLHLATASDARNLRALLSPVLDRLLHTGSPYGKKTKGMDLAELLDAGRSWLEESPRTLAQLRPLIAARWPDRDAQALSYAIHYSLPLVQLPPRGAWRKSGQAVCTTLEAWTQKPAPTKVAAAPIIRRYLAAFGPASGKDLQAWSGIPRAGALLGAIPDLVRLEDEHGRELYDVPGAPFPGEKTAAPPRFLPDYDNVWLAHADRRRIVSDEDRARFPATSSPITMFLVDGFLRGSWSIARTGDVATLHVSPVRPLGKHAAAVRAEGKRLLAFLAPEARRHVLAL